MASLITTTKVDDHKDVDFFTLYRVDDPCDDCVDWLEHLKPLSQYYPTTRQEK